MELQGHGKVSLSCDRDDKAPIGVLLHSNTPRYPIFHLIRLYLEF